MGWSSNSVCTVMYRQVSFFDFLFFGFFFIYNNNFANFFFTSFLSLTLFLPLRSSPSFLPLPISSTPYFFPSLCSFHPISFAPLLSHHSSCSILLLCFFCSVLFTAFSLHFFLLHFFSSRSLGSFSFVVKVCFFLLVFSFVLYILFLLTYFSIFSSIPSFRSIFPFSLSSLHFVFDL